METYLSSTNEVRSPTEQENGEDRENEKKRFESWKRENERRQYMSARTMRYRERRNSFLSIQNLNVSGKNRRKNSAKRNDG